MQAQPALDRANPFTIRSAGLRWSLLKPMAERLLAFGPLGRIYTDVCSRSREQSFVDRSLQVLDVHCDVEDTALATIPVTGPLVVVANHPFGGLDGLILLSLILRRRPDVKLLANHLLARIPELAEHCLFVDPFGTEQSTARNIGSLKAAIRHVRAGGALAVFPAGEVARYSTALRCVADPAWSRTIARIIHHTRPVVQPVFFQGRNSLLFHAAGMVHPKLGTVLLPRELLNKRGCRVQVQIGSPIPASRLERFTGEDELIQYLRLRTEILGARSVDRRHVRPARAKQHSLAEPVDPAELQREIDALPAGCRLLDSGAMSVYIASYPQMPAVMNEIGRLRELSFRGVGEGTGKAADIDEFDPHYLHLFVWQRETRQVVGSYRLGLTDRIVAERGVEGLYTSGLFGFGKPLLDQIGSAIELGRSFIRPEFQKEYAPLLLLWKGIGAFICANPKYKTLIGAVSISDDFHSLSKQLLMSFMRQNCMAPDLAAHVSPPNPPRQSLGRRWEHQFLSTSVAGIDDVDELIQQIESDRRAIPVLVRQYMKLNAKLLAFNIDPDFGDVLDGLMFVDLTSTERALITRFLGRQGAETFLKFHGLQPAAQ
jgi:putative hemolysin